MPDFIPPLRIMLVDDHPLIRDGIRASLELEDGISVVGEAGDGESAIEKIAACTPNLVLMDLNLPGLTGLETTTQLLLRHRQIKVIILTMHEQVEYIVESIRCGASGYLSKTTQPAELSRAVRIVAGGGTYFEPGAVGRFLRQGMPSGGRSRQERKDRLTPREGEVLDLIAQGRTNREIAAQLAVGVRTVETYRERLMKKLDLHNTAEITRYALARQGTIR